MAMLVDADSLASACAAVREHLEAARLALARHMREYPRPVAGCDAQFNHLLERRQAIGRELARLDGIVTPGRSEAGRRRALEAASAGRP